VRTHYRRKVLEAAELEKEGSEEIAPEEDALQPLIALASALLDTDRLRVAAALVTASANRMELSQATGIAHKELLRQLDLLQEFGLVKLKEPAPRQPDAYSPYELNTKAFRAARQAMGKYKGVKPRPKDARLLTLETFLPGGKLVALPKKGDQMITILNEVVQRFEPEKRYAERDVNVILEEVNEDYCTIRRLLVDYGYMERSGGIYMRKT